MAFGDHFADAVGEGAVAPFEASVHGLSVSVLCDPFGVIFDVVLDIGFEAVLGGDFWASGAVAAQAVVVKSVAVGDSGIGVGGDGAVLYGVDEGWLAGEFLTEFGGEVPAAPDVVEECVDGVGVGEFGFSVEADALGAGNDAQTLPEGCLGGAGAEAFAGGLSDADGDAAFGLFGGLDGLYFLSGDLSEAAGEVCDGGFESGIFGLRCDDDAPGLFFARLGERQFAAVGAERGRGK